MATTYVIDKDEGAGHDYHTLFDAEALNGDATALGGVFFSYRPTSGSADTTACAIAGWTVNSSYFLTVTAATGYEATMPWGSGKALIRLNNTASLVVSIHVKVNYTVIEKLQIDVASTDTTDYQIGIANDAQYTQIRNCVVRGPGNYTKKIGIDTNIGSTSPYYWKIYRNYVYGFSGHSGILGSWGGGGNAANCCYQNTVFDCSKGIDIRLSKDTYKQNYVGSCTTCYSEPTGATTSKNISSDSTSPDGASYQGKNSYSSYFVDYNGSPPNFHLKATDTVLKNAGDDLGSPYNVDFDGSTVTGTWDIGADEYIVTTLTVADLAHSQTADAPILTQKHTLTVSEISHGHVVDAVAVTHKHVISLVDVEHEHTVDAVALTQKHILAIADLSHSQSVDSVALTQKHALSITDVGHGHTVDAPTLTQKHTISLSDLVHGHAVDDAGAVAQKHLIAVADLSHAHGVDAVEGTQKHTLSVAGANHSFAIDNVVLTQKHIISVADALHSHSVDTVTFGMSLALSVADVSHSHGLDAVAVTQKHTLTATDLAHSHGIDTADIIQHVLLTVVDLLHANGLDAVDLAQKHILVLQGISHGHAIDSISFGTATGIVSVAFTALSPGIAFTARQPGITFTARA